MILTLAEARAIVDEALAEGGRLSLAPLCAVVLDVGGNMLALARDERASGQRPAIATAKASGCIALGADGVGLSEAATHMPVFFSALATVLPGGCVALPGGRLIRRDGAILGAVGVSGDMADQDERCAIAALRAAGFDAS